ncbi:MAG: winged helix-turn-helix domain-containing protein [Terracidiphilus sp.]
MEPHLPENVSRSATDCSNWTLEKLYFAEQPRIGFVIGYTEPKTMTDPQPARRYRFGAFEADATTGELRRQGVRIKLNAQPFQVLLMLLERPDELLTREEISRELWPDGIFVDYEHGVNSAVNRIRIALGDKAGHPRFVETLARRGYRFVAPVERIALGENPLPAVPEPPSPIARDQAAAPAESCSKHRRPILASPQELPKASYPVVQTFFVLMQFMYLGFYVGALANLAEIEDLFSALPKASLALNLLIVTAAILIPVRAFVLSATLFHAPGVRGKFLRLWPFLLPLDVLWALAPFLLLHHINVGLALACMTLLVYSPFAQRSLVLMGAGGVKQEISAAAP